MEKLLHLKYHIIFDIRFLFEESHGSIFMLEMYRILLRGIACLQSFQRKTHRVICLMCLIVCINHTNDKSKKHENQRSCKFNLNPEYQNPLMSKIVFLATYRLISFLLSLENF